MNNLKAQLIEILSENARYTNQNLADMLGVSAKEVEVAISELEKQGVIAKYSAILNTEAMEETDRMVQALIEVKVAPQKLKGFDSYAEEIYTFKEVKSLYLMSGGFDLAIFIEGKHITDIAKFVAEKLSVIEGIASVQTHFILKKYKIEGHITNSLCENKRQIIQA